MGDFRRRRRIVLYYLFVLSLSELLTPASIALGAVIPKCESFSVVKQNLFQFDEAGKAVEKYKIPLREGKQFAWSVLLRTKCNIFPYTEKFALAAKSIQWGGESRVILSDGKTSETPHVETLQRHVVKGESLGMIMGSWQISKGDPLGSATIEILVDGKSIARIPFEFVKE